MIINCGKRRLISYAYGWKIEIQKAKKEGGELYWTEDSPAWPASLEQACQMVCERELKDMPDIPIGDLKQSLQTAAGLVSKYMTQARRAA